MDIENTKVFSNEILKALEDNTEYFSKMLEEYCNKDNNKFVYKVFAIDFVDSYIVLDTEGTRIYDNHGKLFDFFYNSVYNNKFSFYYDFVTALKKYNNMLAI